MSNPKRGRPPVPGSMRSRILREVEKHPGGVMVLDLCAWLDIENSGSVRKALESLMVAGFVHAVKEPVRGGGGHPPLRYFHKSYPLPVQPAPVPTFKPQPAEVIVRFQDLGPGRYLKRESWVDNYLPSRSSQSQWGGL